MDRFNRWFVVVAGATFVAALVYTALRVPTEDRLERAFMTRLLLKTSAKYLEEQQETPDQVIDRLLSESGSFKTWALQQDASYRDAVKTLNEQIRKDSSSNPYIQAQVPHEIDLRADAEQHMFEFEQELSIVDSDVNGVGRVQVEFILSVFGLFWALPFSAAYALVVAARWAQSGVLELPLFSRFRRRTDSRNNNPAPSVLAEAENQLIGEKEDRHVDKSPAWTFALTIGVCALGAMSLSFAILSAVDVSAGTNLSRPYTMGLAEYLVAYMLFFGIAWVVMRRMRSSTRGKLTAAFFMGWVLLPAVGMALAGEIKHFHAIKSVLPLLFAPTTLYIFSVPKRISNRPRAEAASGSADTPLETVQLPQE